MNAVPYERSRSLRIAVVVAAGLGLVAGHAYAQGLGGGKGFDGGRGGVQQNAAKDAERAKSAQERESAYKDALKRIPEAKPEKNDPWKGAR